MSNNTDVLSKVKSDPVIAERLRCGGCQRALNQVADFSLVDIPNKKRSSEQGNAKGFLCDQCQKDPARSKEGPRQAVYTDSFGDVRIDFYDNLVDAGAGTAAAASGTSEEAPETKSTSKRK